MNFSEVDRSAEFTVRQLAQVVWCHKTLFVFCALVFVTAVGWLMLRVQPRYEATVQLITGQGGLEKAFAGSRQPIEMAATLSTIVESEEVIPAAVDNVGLQQLVGDLYPNRGSLVDQLRQGVAFAREKIGFDTLEVRQPDVSLTQALLPAISKGLIVRADEGRYIKDFIPLS